MTPLTRAQRHALSVVAAAETAGRPARSAGRTTTAHELPGAAWFHVHYQTARNLTDLGLIRDEMRPTGDGLYLTPTGHTLLETELAT